ncbi:Crp/Fnr family transcriptional regulator [Rahnella aquatilis]|nr:Crp/Fnr family transcriptional regulator [Rahnella aquatilis]
MAQMLRKNAEGIITKRGWLSHMPDAFKERLLQHAQLLEFNPGQIIFSPGDAPGGIYGFVAGTVILSTAPAYSTPRLIDMVLPGDWTGEDGFMTGKPRRFQLVAQNSSWMMHVPLDAMEQMARHTPNDMRAFGVISILASDSLLRIVHDLQKKNVSARIASALHRMCSATKVPVPLSQVNLSIIANTSRSQVNSTIQYFVEKGWVETGYRSISVINPSELWNHAESNESD